MATGSWLENIDRTHLALASGKLVLSTRKKALRKGVTLWLSQVTRFKPAFENIHVLKKLYLTQGLHEPVN